MSRIGERVELVPGYTISRIVKGGWQLAGGHGPVDRRQAVDEMRRFVEAGVTTFDCADIYTGVEELIGDFIREYRRDEGADAASRVQVHTKYVPDLDALATLTRDDVTRAIDRSLTRLRVERIDLVQLHWWDYGVPRHVEVATWLAGLQRAGKIRLIGATNFDRPHLTQILDAGVQVVAHQVQYSPVDRRPEHGMSDLCRARRIGLLCYGALAGGFIAETYLGAAAPEGPLENRSLVKYRLVIDEWGSWALFQDLLARLRAVAGRHAVGIGAVAVRWVLDRPQVAGVIVGARHAGHLDDTLAALALRLDEEDRHAIDEVVARAQGPLGDIYDLERVRGGRHAAIMRYNLNALTR